MKDDDCEMDYEKKKVSAQCTALNFPSESAEMIEFKMSHLTCVLLAGMWLTLLTMPEEDISYDIPYQP